MHYKLVVIQLHKFQTRRNLNAADLFFDKIIELRSLVGIARLRVNVERTVP